MYFEDKSKLVELQIKNWYLKNKSIQMPVSEAFVKINGNENSLDGRKSLVNNNKIEKK